MPDPARDADGNYLVARAISKRFGVTQALRGVTVSFARGEVHALMGENGAGKSTLGKVIAGLHRQDEGEVILDGRRLVPGSLDDAFDAGVRLVHQELAQCPNLSVAENLCLHDMPVHFGRGGMGVVDFRTMRERAARLVHALDSSIDVEAPLGSLSPGRRQVCQIAAALDEGVGSRKGAHGPRVIVLDEPTSSLSLHEAQRLMLLVRRLAQSGITILYVSHRMGEIFEVCDRVTVLRDGAFVATSIVKDIDEPALIEQMIGRRIETVRSRDAQSSDSDDTSRPPALEVRGLSSPGRLHDISLAIRPGEVLGVGGLVGCGRSEMLDAIFGLDPAARGEVRVNGHRLATASVHDSIRAGLGYVPEDRRLQGLFFLLSVAENTTMPFLPRLAHTMGVRSRSRERAIVRDRFESFRVKTASTSSLPGELSGGNQQKLLLARWMGAETKVLLLDEPTRGIDVGTKHEVYKLVRQAAARGAAILLVSSEMPELLALSDRVLVMREGRISGELRGAEVTQANILRLATD